MGILNLLSVFFLTFDQLARGKFVTPVCRAGTGNCVQQNSKGTRCYAPDPYYTPTTAMTSCTASGADYVTVELQGALQSHLKQNLYITGWIIIDLVVSTTSSQLHQGQYACAYQTAGEPGYCKHFASTSQVIIRWMDSLFVWSMVVLPLSQMDVTQKNSTPIPPRPILPNIPRQRPTL